MLHVIACFERPIERKTIGLVRSLFDHFSHKSGFKVFLLSPRANVRPSQAAIDEVTGLGAEYLPLDLNTDYPYYPLANKPIACAYIERNHPAEEYVFIDSDTLFLNPTTLSTPSTPAVQLRPVDSKNIGVATLDEANGPYWRALYAIAGAAPRRRVVPSSGAPELLEYYNSGFVYSNMPDLCQRWLELFAKVMYLAIRPNLGLFYTEQSCLSACVTANAEHLSLLSNDLNYPIHLHFENKISDRLRIDDPDKLKHIHYHKIFDNPETMADNIKYAGLESKALEICRYLDWET